jgi:hypothetical protein
MHAYIYTHIHTYIPHKFIYIHMHTYAYTHTEAMDARIQDSKKEKESLRESVRNSTLRNTQLQKCLEEAVSKRKELEGHVKDAENRVERLVRICLHL